MLAVMTLVYIRVECVFDGSEGNRDGYYLFTFIQTFAFSCFLFLIYSP